jgi:SAM-dependent methyltransferase
VVYDIGCGDGRFLVTAARTGALAVGIERDPVLVARCHKRIQEALPELEAVFGAPREGYPHPRVHVVQGDATVVEDLAGATVVFIYLVPAGITKVLGLLEAVLCAGGRIVSNVFAVPGWVATNRKLAKGLPVYLYDAPDCMTASAEVTPVPSPTPPASACAAAPPEVSSAVAAVGAVGVVAGCACAVDPAVGGHCVGVESGEDLAAAPPP